MVVLTWSGSHLNSALTTPAHKASTDSRPNLPPHTAGLIGFMKLGMTSLRLQSHAEEDAYGASHYHIKQK